uniref:DUF433 domain-containing protein n=1 Tax=uncultured Caulobacter sp. TaxID=158749 RepID=UPI0025DE3BAD|nr:DUF433 domain-containing protein [uncultured Caulobacter sp.]
MTRSAAPLTANEAASVTRVPLKQVHRIIDAGLLLDGVQVRSGSRLISGRALVGLRLAHLTAESLTAEARRRVIRRVLEDPRATTVEDHAVTVPVTPAAADVLEGLETLDRAKAEIVTDPAILAGAPCVVGTRIPAHDLADMVANGESIEAVVAAYPSLTANQVRLASVYATAYPRRGRPPVKPAWRQAEPTALKTVSLDALPKVS